LNARILNARLRAAARTCFLSPQGMKIQLKIKNKKMDDADADLSRRVSTEKKPSSSSSSVTRCLPASLFVI
jgi:hypothetical protein